jgi:DNA-binding transcriptional LysR family regulator
MREGGAKRPVKCQFGAKTLKDRTMDASDLRIFAAVARLGGMNRAAAELNTVQSNVTARIRALEAELEVPLFRRTSRGTELTAAGERLLPYAARVIQLLDEARRAARDDGAPRGALVIGSLETTAALRLTPHLASFVAAYPEVDLTLRTGTSCELVDAVLARQLEGAFICGPVEHDALDSEVMFREELVILSAPGVTSLDACLRAKEMRGVVLRAGCSYRLILEAWLARQGIVDVRQLEFGTLEAIIGCVRAGLGITLLPKALIGKVWQDGLVAVHPLPRGEGHVETVFIRRRDERASSALGVFLDHIRPGLARLQAAE